MLWLHLCYQNQRDGTEHRSGPSAFVRVGFAGAQAGRQLWSPGVLSPGWRLSYVTGCLWPPFPSVVLRKKKKDLK